MAKLSGKALELYNLPPVGECPFKVGDLIEKNGVPWEIRSINKKLRPYGKKNQDTYAVGYAYGLKECNLKGNNR